VPRHSRALWFGLLAVCAALAVSVWPVADSPSSARTPDRIGGTRADRDVVAFDVLAQAADRSASPARAGQARVRSVDARTSGWAEPGTVRPVSPSVLSGYRWPLAHPRLTLPFGPSPWGSRIVGGRLFHDGVDMATFCGDRVVAAHDGTVLAAGRRFDQLMGWQGDLAAYYARLDEKHAWDILPIMVIVDDGNGYRSLYAHFERVVVRPGQAIHAGDLLGYEGRTGRASGCHVHYGLFSPLEDKVFEISAKVVDKLLLPRFQTARIDPLLVLPPLPRAAATPAPGRGGVSP
jgi:murein DD-endopeptidase MepM/ murein hydrolase activator NlpD